MKLKCQHCNYEWDYNGYSDYYCTCPRCNYKVNVKKNQVKQGEVSES